MLWKTAPRAADTPRPENPDAGLYRTPFQSGNRNTPLRRGSIQRRGTRSADPRREVRLPARIPAANQLNDVRQDRVSNSCDCRTNRGAVYASLRRCQKAGSRVFKFRDSHFPASWPLQGAASSKVRDCVLRWMCGAAGAVRHADARGGCRRGKRRCAANAGRRVSG